MKNDAAPLVRDFVESLTKQAEAIRCGTTKQARYYGDRSHRAAKRLVMMGDMAIGQFGALLEHPSRKIRVTTAVYLLNSLPDAALATLKEVAKGDDFHAECARLRIKEWEEHPEHYDPKNWAR